MKQMNKKGFTIVELVIVIAVIAILAGVLIPTFSGIVEKANQSSALQEATSTMKSTLSMSDYGTITNGTQFVIVKNGKVAYKFEYKNNQIDAIKATDPAPTFNIGEATDLPFNSVIIYRAEGSDSTLTAGEKEMIMAATGLTAAQWTATTDTLTATADGYTFDINGDTDGGVYNLFTNSDYAKDIVTVTYSN